jgi:hypothetical protein
VEQRLRCACGDHRYISFDLLDIARARAQAGPQQSLSDAIVNTGAPVVTAGAAQPLFH